LTGKDVSLVSAIPGTTRDVIEGFFAFKGRSFRILDTAGIRRKNRVNQDVEYYSVHRAFKAVEEADVVYLLVDASEEVSDQDKKIAEQVVKRGKGIIIVLNKWDVRLASNDAMEKPFSKEDVFKAVRDRVRFVFPVLKFAPIVPISALEQTGLDKLINITLTVYGQLNRSLDTSKLNSMMGKWLMDYTPPRDRAAQFKPRYITQTGTNPVKFLLFVNRVKGFPEGWVQYLKNKLRKDAGLDSIPFSIDLKQS
ncbi:MAG: GTP-binding protein, partial [Spirochaetales bacterium]